MYTYALIDGVKRPMAIKELYTGKEPIQTIPLYINTPYKDNYDLGPILVAALEHSNLINHLTKEWFDSTTLIQTNQPLSKIAEHLQQLIVTTDETAVESLFRFADPLTTWYWLNSYTDEALVDVMGPIEQWKVPIPVADWQPQQLKWQTFIKPQNKPLGFTINYLGEPQEEALEQATEFQFKNKIYHWLQKENPSILQNKTPNQIADWLQDALTEAKAFNLISERSLVMWIDLTADYGANFATDTKGLYQQWLTDNPKQQPMPAEIKIQKFYEYLNT